MNKHSRMIPCLVLLGISGLPAWSQGQQWIRQVGSTVNDSAYAAARDGAGGLFVGGLTYGAFGGSYQGGGDAWIGRFDRSGNPIWLLQLGSSSNDRVTALSEDGGGGVFLAGYTGGSLGGPFAGKADAWVARIHAGGTLRWIRQLGTAELDAAHCATGDGIGGVFVGGETDGDLGGPSKGHGDAWLGHYDGAGNLDWSRLLGTKTGSDSATAMAADGTGGVYVGGRTPGSLGGPSQGSWDAWLARYDGLGTLLWKTQLGTSGVDDAYAAAPDGSGGVFVGGRTDGDLGAASAGGIYDAWLARYDGAGNLLWVSQIGSDGKDWVTAAASDGAGGAYVTGVTEGSLGSTSNGGQDAWLARLDSAGGLTWIRQLGTSSTDRGWGCAWDGSLGVFVVGETLGALGGPSAGGYDAWLARYDGGGTPTVYCTGKPSSLGCTPAIDLSGPISAGAGTGCTLDASSLVGGVLGLFFHSTAGSQAKPFHGGFLCVQPPLRWHPVQGTGGTVGSCDGVLTEDLNAYIASGADPALVAGAGVWLQAWSRDPGDPFGDSLSDAVTAVICP